MDILGATSRLWYAWKMTIHRCVCRVQLTFIHTVVLGCDQSERVVYVCRPLNQQFAERLKSVFLQTVQNPAGPEGVATQRMSSGELAEKISGLWVNAKQFEKGLKLFDGEDVYS